MNNDKIGKGFRKDWEGPKVNFTEQYRANAKDTLKDCPFCGGAASVEFSLKIDPHVQCGSCLAKAYYYENIEEAVQAWNRRIDEH